MAKKNEQKIKFEADVTGFKKNIKEAEKSITSLNSILKLNKTQLAGNGSSTQLLGQRLDELKQKYQQQTTAIENTEKAYEKAVEYFGENSKEAEGLSKKLVELKTAQQRTANEINEVNKKLIIQSEKFISAGKDITKFGDKLTKLGGKINDAGNKLSVLSAGVGAVVGASIKSSISFESAWTGVTKTVDGTEEQLSELRQGMLDLSREIPSTAEEIANVGEAAGQLGIQTENILDFSKAMIDLGNSTNLSSEDAASQLAKFANITEMSQKDFDKLGSSIVDLGNNFATTEADIVDMAMRLAGAGHQVGMSEGQILGLATALSSVGIEAEMGGSAMSKAMVKMQNAVELGGGKLQDVLKKTGMSLRDLELLSANNSKDFKKLSNSLGLTSTELKNMITAGANLEDFAKISGMSAEQFKKAWKEDATSAISAFIQGLGNTKDKGESAIAMLSEMGITEVRLRDSLLRASNAGDLFNKAIKTGTKAWEKNTALTNEADKRYKTTESQLKKLKNEIRANAIELGDELKPMLVEVIEQAKPLISKTKDLVKWFNNLSGKSKDSAKKIALVTAALGPAVKIGGKMISTTGEMISGYGKLITKVGDLSSKIKIASTTETLATSAQKAQTVATTASTLATETNTGALVAQTTVTTGATVATNLLKVAMIGLPIVGVVAGIATLVGTFKEMNDETAQTNNRLDDYKTSMEEADKAKQDFLNKNLSEIDYYQDLYNELDTIVDKNGKVKDGYEDRAKFIVGTLKDSLGIEIDMTKGVIKKYDSLENKIKDVIKQKRAQTLIEANEEKYNTAREQKNKLEEIYGNILTENKQKEQEKNEALQKMAEYLQIDTEKLQSFIDENGKINNFKLNEYLNSHVELAEKIENNGLKFNSLQSALETTSKGFNESNQTLQEAQTQYDSNRETLANYEKALENMSSKNYDAVLKMYEDSHNYIGKTTEETYNNYQRGIDAQVDYIQRLTENKDKYDQDYIRKQIETSTQVINNLAKEQSQYRQKTQEEQETIKGVWNQGLRDLLKDITGKDILFKKTADGNIQMYVDGIESGKPKTKKKAQNVAEDIVNELNKAKEESKIAGVNIIKGIDEGVNYQKGTAFATIKNFGQTLLAKLKKSLDERSPSKATEEMGVFLLKGLTNGINKEEGSVQKALTKLGTSMLNNVSKNVNSISSVGKSLITNFDTSVTNAIKTSEKNVKKTIDTYFTNLQKENEKQQSKLQKKIDNTKNKTTKKRLQSQLKTLKDQNKEIKSLYNNFGKTAINEFNSAIEASTNGTTDKLKAKLQELADKMQQEIDNVNNKIASMKDKLSGYGDLFTKENKEGQEIVSLTDINKQINALQKYNNNLTKLKGNISDNLMGEITNMSIDDAVMYTDKLLSLSEVDFKAYNDAYNRKINLANEIANNFYADKISEIKNNYTDKIKEEFESTQKEIEKIGSDTIKGFINGMKKNNYTKDIKSLAQDIVKTMKSELKSNSVFKAMGIVYPGHKDGLDYVPYDNYIARLHKGERVLTAQENKEYMNKDISDRVSNSIVVNFYPQKMTDSEMENAFNFVNRKFGRLI